MVFFIVLYTASYGDAAICRGRRSRISKMPPSRCTERSLNNERFSKVITPDGRSKCHLVKNIRFCHKFNVRKTVYCHCTQIRRRVPSLCLASSVGYVVSRSDVCYLMSGTDKLDSGFHPCEAGTICFFIAQWHISII